VKEIKSITNIEGDIAMSCPSDHSVGNSPSVSQKYKI